MENIKKLSNLFKEGPTIIFTSKENIRSFEIENIDESKTAKISNSGLAGIGFLMDGKETYLVDKDRFPEIFEIVRK